jgi:hypothetical protein
MEFYEDVLDIFENIMYEQAQPPFAPSYYALCARNA